MKLQTAADHQGNRLPQVRMDEWVEDGRYFYLGGVCIYTGQKRFVRITREIEEGFLVDPMIGSVTDLSITVGALDRLNVIEMFAGYARNSSTRLQETEAMLHQLLSDVHGDGDGRHTDKVGFVQSLDEARTSLVQERKAATDLARSIEDSGWGEPNWGALPLKGRLKQAKWAFDKVPSPDAVQKLNRYLNDMLATLMRDDGTHQLKHGLDNTYELGMNILAALRSPESAPSDTDPEVPFSARPESFLPEVVSCLMNAVDCLMQERATLVDKLDKEQNDE